MSWEPSINIHDDTELGWAIHEVSHYGDISEAEWDRQVDFPLTTTIGEIREALAIARRVKGVTGDMLPWEHLPDGLLRDHREARSAMHQYLLNGDS